MGLKMRCYWEHIKEYFGNINKNNLAWHTPIFKRLVVCYQVEHGVEYLKVGLDE
jgi:hypothetical protein